MEILHEDSDILVCYKEAGLAVQSARLGKKDLVSMLKTHLWEQTGKKKEPYLGIVHRLDQPVEGILVFAKSPQAAGKLCSQLTDGRMKKVYQAVVMTGSKKMPETGCLEDYLLKDARTNSSKVVPEGTKGAKLASLEYRVLQRLDLKTDSNYDTDQSSDTGLSMKIALMEIILHTGRHHQIRVQMAHAGMPLLGDQKYGSFRDQKGNGGSFGDIRFPALCSVRLAFVHPGTGKQVEFSCEPRGEAFEAFRNYSKQGI